MQETVQERNLHFDEVVDRRHTDSLKFDFAARRGMPADILPLWVADMDFRTSSHIVDAVARRAEHGIFGYTDVGGAYYEAVKDWMWARHGMETKPEWMVKTPGVVFALAMAVRAFTDEGDAVLIQQPVYYPFSGVIADNHRRVVSSDLTLGEDGKYHIDFDDFAEKIRQYRIKLFLLCSPHNPVGRVWTREELAHIGQICLKEGVTVVSDEIHEDFVFEGYRHLPFADICEAHRDITVTCTSPGKTFNLAGLQVSNIFIPNQDLRRRFQKQIQASGYSQLNTLGLVACEAAYRYGAEWYGEMMRYLQGNLAFFREFSKTRLPRISLIEPEGTYLLWLDFRKLGLGAADLEHLIVNRAGLWLDGGEMFGNAGAGFQRVNIATNRKTLALAIEKLERALDA